MSASGRWELPRALAKSGIDGDDEVVGRTYEEPFRSLSCITRRVSQRFKARARSWRWGCNRTCCTSQSGVTRTITTTCAGNGQLTLIIASLIMSAVKTRQQPAKTMEAVPKLRDQRCRWDNVVKRLALVGSVGRSCAARLLGGGTGSFLGRHFD